jgi:hypothetical protein
MASVISTTTAPSTYGDGLKAMSIKALEQRQKDILAQNAAQQPDTASMATIPGGIGHVLGVAADGFREMQSNNALAANRADLAKVMSGYDRDKGLTGEQQAVLSRVAPEILDKLMQHNEERWKTTTVDTGQTNRADALNRTTLENTDRTNAGAMARTKLQEEAATGRTDSTNTVTKDVAKLKDTGDTARTVLQITSKEKEGASDRAQADAHLASKQAQEVKMANVQAAIKRAEQERDYANSHDMFDRKTAAEKEILRLGNEYKTAEAEKGRAHDMATLAQRYANDLGLQDKLLAAKALEADKQIALTREDHAAARQADQDLARIRGDIEAGRDRIKLDYEKERDEADRKTKVDLATKAAEDKKAEAAADPKTNQLRAEMEQRLTHRNSLIDELAAAGADLRKGVHTGSDAGIKTSAGLAPIVGPYIGDREKSERTRRVDNVMNRAAVGDMSTMLKGATTDKEMAEFKRMWNDPSIGIEAKRAQFLRVVDAAQADRDAEARAVKASGGTVTEPASAKPKDDLSRAQAAIDGGAPFEAISNLLKSKGGDPAALKPKAR